MQNILQLGFTHEKHFSKIFFTQYTQLIVLASLLV